MEPNHILLSQENRRQLILNAVSDDERLSLYCEALLADPYITMLPNLDTQRPFDVEQVYVPLRLSQERQLRYGTYAIDEASTKSKEDDPDVWIEEERQRRGEMIYDLEKALHTFHRCAITGGSGAGKTTILRHLAIMAAQRSIAKVSSLLPIYVELQSFVRSGLHDLLDFVSTTWEEAYGFPAQLTRLLLANFLDEGKALLLLDALDETVVGERADSEEQSYEALSQAILTLAAGYPKAAIAVTTRQASYKQHKPLAGFTTLELMDLRFEDVKQLMQNWYEAANDLHIEEKRTDLIKRLDEKPSLQVLVANPLLLTLMVLAYEDQWDLPGRSADLYRMCIEKLLAKRDARPGARRQEFKPEQKHQLLKVIAWHFHCKRQRYFTEHDLLQILAAFLPAIGLPVERKHEMLQEIESEQAILQKQVTGWHGFLHLTFQEYLAAEYINDYQEEAELFRHRADPWWEEVMLLYLGITPDASFFLQQLYTQNGSMREDMFSTNVLLAGRCLRARPTVRESELPAQIIERLFELVMSAPFSLLRQEAITVVCSIGVVETNKRLVTLLSDNQLHAFVHRSITGALGSLGEPSVADDLVQLLSDEQLDVNLRRSIVDALGSLGEPSVADDLVQLLADEQLDIDLRRSIVTALGRLGERSIANDLVQLLSDERLDVNLRRSIADVLGTLGERSVADDLVQMLADEQLNTELRKSIADALGVLGELSVATELVQLLADEQLNTELRRSIADALGTLGEPSVTASVMVQLLADEQQDMFVRRSITGALGILGEPSVADDLVQLLADERLNTELRKSIADALGTLGERTVVGDLVQLLLDDHQDVAVRRTIAIALGTLGERLVASRVMVQLLSDDQLDVNLRWSIADALGTLGERSVATDLVQLLLDDQLDVNLRWSIANTLGTLGERSVATDLVQLLSDDQLDVNLRWSIADALGTLGERAVAARVMVQLLSNDRLGVFVRRNIADALGMLGERSVAADLVQLLSDKRLHAFIRRNIVDALGTLGEPSVAADLVHLLSDKPLEVVLRRSIADTLAVYTRDLSTVRGLVKSLPDKEISDSVFHALWTISRRARVWIVPGDLTDQSSVTQAQAPYEIVPW